MSAEYKPNAYESAQLDMRLSDYLQVHRVDSYRIACPSLPDRPRRAAAEGRGSFDRICTDHRAESDEFAGTGVPDDIQHFNDGSAR